jgi:hypothetical protein
MGAKPQVKGAQGLVAGPTPRSVGHTLSWFKPRHGGYVHTSVETGRSGWPAMWMARAILHLQTDSIKSVEAPLYLYIRILMVESHTTLFL